MKYKLLLMSLISGFLYSSQQDYQISISTRGEPQTLINGMASYCECGKSPILVMFLFGRMQLYCQEHMPEIERVRRVTPENLAEILRKES